MSTDEIEALRRERREFLQEVTRSALRSPAYQDILSELDRKLDEEGA